MKNFIKNKRADERYLSIWMILVWIIIAAGIAIGIIIFFSVKADVRYAEADTLAVKILDCISENFDYGEISDPEFSIYDFCDLDESVITDTGYYYFSLSILDSQTDSSLFELFGGNPEFIVQCAYQKDKRLIKPDFTELNFAQCSYKHLHVTDDETGESYILSVLAASNQK